MQMILYNQYRKNKGGTAMRVTDHVYVLSGGCYAAVNDNAVLGEVYGVRSPKGMILIDCGPEKTGLACIREALDYYGISDPITHVLLTHGHWDHCGSAAELQREGAKIVVGAEDTVACVNSGNRNPDNARIDGEPPFPGFIPDMEIKEDCVIEADGISFEYIKIPGHTAGSAAIKLIIDGKTILFTGDALQPGGRMLGDVSFGWEGDATFCKNDIVKSMQKLKNQQADILLPGHGRICLRNGTRMLRFAAEVVEEKLKIGS